MRTAILADIHGNSPALRAVLSDARLLGCERLLVLGDVINGYDPGGCMELLGNWKDAECLRGNSEAYLLTPNLADFPEAETEFYSRLLRLLNWFRAQLTQEQLAALQQWKNWLKVDGALLAHDNPLDRLFPQRWYKPGVAEPYQEIYFHSPGLSVRSAPQHYAEVDEWMGESGIGLVFVGHTHEPFLRDLPHGTLCNAGSVGLPLDGDPRPSWVLAEGRLERGCRLEIRRPEYAVSEYTALIDVRRDNPDWSIPGQAQAYRRMVETGTHWRTFLPAAQKKDA